MDDRLVEEKSCHHTIFYSPIQMTIYFMSLNKTDLRVIRQNLAFHKGLLDTLSRFMAHMLSQCTLYYRYELDHNYFLDKHDSLQ